MTSMYHRLRDSGSTVVTMTSKVNEKMEILTTCRSETPGFRVGFLMSADRIALLPVGPCLSAAILENFDWHGSQKVRCQICHVGGTGQLCQ